MLPTVLTVFALRSTSIKESLEAPQHFVVAYEVPVQISQVTTGVAG
jgi:hypothetical protein